MPRCPVGDGGRARKFPPLSIKHGTQPYQHAFRKISGSFPQNRFSPTNTHAGAMKMVSEIRQENARGSLPKHKKEVSTR